MIDLFTIYIICVFAAGHYVGDFILQTRRMGLNKSSNNFILSDHCIIYAYTVLAFWCIFVFLPLVQFDIINLSMNNIFLLNFLIILYLFVTHFVTDWVTSRLSAKFWKKGDEKTFWNVIGLDQLIHIVTLLILINQLH